MKNSLEKSKKINNEWDENNLVSLINDCINIENSIETINLINENAKKDFNNKPKVKIINENETINNLLQSIYQFAKIDYNQNIIPQQQQPTKSQNFLFGNPYQNVAKKVIPGNLFG